MKKTIYITLLAVIALGLSSCKKEFLDKEPSGLFTPGQLEKAAKWNPNILRGQASGIVATTFAAGAGGFNSHSDFGQKSIDIQLDLMSGDMEMPRAAYTHFQNAADLSGTRTRQTLYSYGNWRYFYKIVFAANAVFDANGSDEKVPNNDIDAKFFGQAKILRGYAYFYLANLYAKPYQMGADNQAVPIYLSAKTSEPGSLSTIKQVYELAIKDLKEAYEVLKKYPRAIKDDVDAQSALGYLAYAYLQTGKYKEAYDVAMQLVNSTQYRLMTSKEVIESGFNHYSNPEFIWSIDLTTSNTGSLLTFWGHVDIFTYSYAFAGDYKMINQFLYEQIPSDDVRKKWFMAPSDARFPLTPVYKFYDSGRKIAGDRKWTNDEVYLRTAEMYLIAMESAAKLNNDVEAKRLLNLLMSNRFNEYNYVGKEVEIPAKKAAVAAEINALGHNELLDKIFYNWRVELWGEGRSLFTFKRFEKDMNRTTRSAFLTGQTIKWNDERLVFEIPEFETSNNPNIKK